LTPDKAGQYAALFEKSGAQGGILPGEQAKQIFERAGLPNETLGRIWTLADTEQRGALQVTEFVIAMHLLASFKAGSLRVLPNTLPVGLYEAAARRPPSRQTSSNAGISGIPREFTGTGGAARAAAPISRPSYPGAQLYPQASGSAGDWAITPADKAKFDSIYVTLDKTNKGFITGDEAVPFFSESKLPEEALAQIWDLADINSAGRLSRDEFAVAMFLIRQQRTKRDARDSLPATLPPNLIPPSMRNQTHPAALPTAPAFENAAPTLPKSAADDLFGLDALSSAPAPAPSSLDGSAFGERGPMTPTSPTHGSPPPPPPAVFKPFAPSSSFGQTLTYHATGGSNTSGPSQQRGIQQQPSATEDLLGDNDPEISKRLTNETTELANLSNQVGNLSKQMHEVQSQRATSQNELTQATSQKREFEARLAQLRSLYEQEVKDVKSLEEKLTASRNETKKLHTDFAMIEGTLKDLQNQHRQTSAALQADQQENASLKERMRLVNAETAQLKPALEKLRSDARQQKGLVAINKKQLATNESEREKLKAEAEELNKSIEEDTKALAAAEAAAKIQSPAPVASPAPSTMSANNPFFRRQGSTSETSHSSFTATPPAAQQDRSFDNLFGPSFGAPPNEAHAPTHPQDSEVRSASGTLAAAVPVRTASASGSGFPSPVASPGPAISREVSHAAEPPPPPESRQISSSFLPFRAEPDESVTSSRQVSAPNSRFGEGSVSADTATNYTGATPAGSSATGGQPEVARESSPGLDWKSNASPAAVAPMRGAIPGAFLGDASDIIATPTGGSNISEQGGADPFTSKGLPRSGTSKEDFDSAFAGFGNSAKPQERSNTGGSSNGSSVPPPSGFNNKEFPPIAELDHDDDSDSGSEGGGFDDDFAPASPERSRQVSSVTQPAASAANGASGLLGAGPHASDAAAAMGVGENPPTPGAQASPPAYNKAVSPREQAHSEVERFSGLLPERDDPTSPEHASGASQPIGALPTSSQPAHAKAAFDDDFDEFDDLEDAKEGDADDDFTNISGHDRSGLDDFNPMFDSPPSTKAPEHAAQGSSAFAGGQGFGEFTQSPTQTSRQTTGPAVVNSTNVNDNQDWDAIFADLNGPAPAATTAAEPAKPLGNGTTAAAATTERPAIGRALTETGVHDDPILKNLTGMGYARNDALAALEKYDYNLERVSPRPADGLSG
jgi:epidermal growth factor receptor substrate 15